MPNKNSNMTKSCKDIKSNSPNKQIDKDIPNDSGKKPGTEPKSSKKK